MANISVIVPVYKVEPYIDRCVKSILTQTYTDFELILVDDGSPDNCPAMCDAWAERDSRIVVIHQANGGLSAARNAGIDWTFAHSASEWMTFIDSDDWVHPQYLAKLLDAAVQNDVAVSVCGYAETMGEEPTVDAEATAKLWTPESFFVEKNVNATVAWGKLYRKACFADVRYPVGKIHEDEFTTYKILFCQKTLPVISAPLYAYFQNANGIMRSLPRGAKIHALEAYEESLQYFREKGFNIAFGARANVYFHGLTNELRNISWFRFREVQAKIHLHKKRARLFRWMNSAQRARVCNELHPHLMGIYWRIHSSVCMVFRGEWKKLIKRIRDKICR